MRESTIMNLLLSVDEEKLASILDNLDEEEQDELIEMLNEEEAEKDAEEVEKVAADWLAAGQLFGAGFLSALAEAGE